MTKVLTGPQQLSAMIVLAAQRHDGQVDAQGKPYILHCLKVMHYCDCPDDYELGAICVGHDIIENTKTTYAELRQIGFSERVIRGIESLTKLPGTTEKQQLEQLIGSVNNPTFHNIDGCHVKLADLTHNSDIRRLKSLEEKHFQKLKQYRRWYTAIKAKLAGDTATWQKILQEIT